MLEDELCSYTAAPGQKSPNRLDAMVWCGIELTGMGSLGLIDLFTSGRAAEMVKRKPAMQKVGGATNLAAVTTNEQTPKCPNCGEVTMQHLIAGNQLRCGHCGTQRDPAGTKPAAKKPLGGRAIYFAK